MRDVHPRRWSDRHQGRQLGGDPDPEQASAV